MASLIKISLFLLSSLSFLHLNYAVPSSSSLHSLPPLIFSFHPCYSPPLCSQFCKTNLSVSPFQVDLCMFFLGFMLLLSNVTNALLQDAPCGKGSSPIASLRTGYRCLGTTVCLLHRSRWLSLQAV